LSSNDEDSSSSGDMCDSEVSSSEELGTGIRAIVQRQKKKIVEKEERKKKKMQEKEDRQKAEEGERPRKKDAERDENYVFLNFMKKNHKGDSLQWPSKTDMLNVLREDILFSCDPPIPSAGTSSSRAPTFSLSKRE
jgi:hypothetical protein